MGLAPSPFGVPYKLRPFLTFPFGFHGLLVPVQLIHVSPSLLVGHAYVMETGTKIVTS